MAEGLHGDGGVRARDKIGTAEEGEGGHNKAETKEVGPVSWLVGWLGEAARRVERRAGGRRSGMEQ
jgi:hypothetical protein